MQGNLNSVLRLMGSKAVLFILWTGRFLGLATRAHHQD